MEANAAAVTAGVAKQKLEFAYDLQGRRVSRKMFSWSGSAWVLAKQIFFLYDSWNMVAELNALSSNAALRTYAWGLDLSGTFQGAGGVGGLVMANDGSGTFFTAYDGNGNLTTYVSAGTGNTAATYQYSAFGETLTADGAGKGIFQFGFSTKYQDAESGLLYYGFRYYRPAIGRWLSRDEIGEAGGPNLYGMSGNDTANNIDYLGRVAVTDIPSIMRSNGWVNGAALMDHWFGGTGTTDKTTITMAWALSFARAKEV